MRKVQSNCTLFELNVYSFSSSPPLPFSSNMPTQYLIDLIQYDSITSAHKIVFGWYVVVGVLASHRQMFDMSVFVFVFEFDKRIQTN